MLEELQGSGCGWTGVSNDVCVFANRVTDSPVGRGCGEDSECYSKHHEQLVRAESREVT